MKICSFFFWWGGRGANGEKKKNSIAKQGEQTQANQNQVRSRKIYAAKNFI
jgi:hypothetical protein